ncbi:UbiA prenyltransferase family protein [Bdellovibrio reynosensis]|uniref:UbiA family prenyltransferase n=1 Tax=Bdellovibrio reynosensis TaxID=2835041 RepID=A0ABY4C9C7_9BACT|nr:UbiA family prenyltransferase [Bdellovibrio reynosensis]UOF01079.1 UbiA family prenyltransferase [Bdellovibrio reynosensis]
MLSFFFRMRLFDEIKDYEVDLKVNPTRPLARGILSVIQVKKALIGLIIFELVLAACFGRNAFLIHAMAIGYSLLMYEEFFIGEILRPHLTTYAVTHTFVSVLLGLSSAVAMSGVDITLLSPAILFFFLMNWAFFNLFEFARKTFAPTEERPHVPSYSNIFGCHGAWALSISQVILGVGIIAWYFSLPLFAVAAGIYILISLGYLLKKTNKTANLFRNISGVYLLLHYLILIYVVGA